LVSSVLSLALDKVEKFQSQQFSNFREPAVHFIMAMKKASLLILQLSSGVFSAFAQGGFTPGSTGAPTPKPPVGNALVQFLTFLKEATDKLIPILVGLAVLAFFWFLVIFIWKGGEDAGERDKMKGGMLWSIIAIFVMVSVWGIIGLFGSLVGVQQGGTMHGFKPPGAL
jgi:uncharacterized membrane protein